MSIAKSYAKALFEAAQEQSLEQKASPETLLGQVESEIKLFLSSLDASNIAKTVLFSPLASTREKISVVEELSNRLQIIPLLRNFMVLLAKKGRLSFLKEIQNAFGAVRLTSEGGVAGQLVAAEPMNETDVGVLAKAFSHKLGKRVAFRVSTDPSLLAGVKVTVNGVTYDGSLRSQIQKLRDRFVTGLSGTDA